MDLLVSLFKLVIKIDITPQHSAVIPNAMKNIAIQKSYQVWRNIDICLFIVLFVLFLSRCRRPFTLSCSRHREDLGYETETISKQEDDAVSVLPLLRGVKNAVYQFLSDSDSEELSCYPEYHACQNDDDCCGDMTCKGYVSTSCQCDPYVRSTMGLC